MNLRLPPTGPERKLRGWMDEIPLSLRSGLVGRIGIASLCLVLLSACQIDARYKATDLGRVGPIPAEQAITPEALIAKYNTNTGRLAKLYARTSVELTWQETREDGSVKNRSESGDGKVIFQAPASTVVTVEKLGKWYLWAGSDGARYWLFDRTQEPSALYVGRLDGPAAKRNFLGLPVRPQDMPMLLGLKPLEPALKTDVAWCVDATGHGFYRVEQPHLRLLLNPKTAWPVRIELTDAAGKAQVVAQLSGAVVCENGGVLRQKAEIFPVKGKARLDLAVDSASVDPDKIKSRMFDLDGTLIPANKPEKTVDLDRP